MAHTANNAVDLIDSRRDQFLRSIPGLTGVAGVLVSDEKNLVFTSNRGEETIGVFEQGKEASVEKVKVGGRPNGLAFDPSRETLLAANVPRPDDAGPVTVSIVDVKQRAMVGDLRVPGRTRWTVFDPETDRFYVNIAEPAQITIVETKERASIVGRYPIPAVGPHGLDIDHKGRQLFCASDDAHLFRVDLESGKVSKAGDLAGAPDVIFFNPRLDHLYVAIGSPGVIQVFDTERLKEVQRVSTEPGTHTIAFNHETSKVYALFPESHRASIYADN